MNEIINEEKPLRKLKEFGESYILTQTDYDLDTILEYLGVTDKTPYTGAVTKIKDGEYVEIWTTENSRPYDLNSVYEQIK